ncbi:hypothetical protein Y695_04478 [Hydrogenophaga sp. T4]|nr:hypothetical protein Y695_04478 [Hydrogenophaga sp. T4]
MTGKVAIQPSGASERPTRPLMAMKTTLLVRNRPCAAARSQRFLFIRGCLYKAALAPGVAEPTV